MGFLNKDKHVKFREMQYTFKLKCIAFDKSFYFVLKSLKIIYFFAFSVVLKLSRATLKFNAVIIVIRFRLT